MDFAKLNDGSVLVMIPRGDFEKNVSGGDRIYMMTAGMLDNLISHMAKRVLELIKDEKNNDEVLNMKQAAKVIGVAPGTLAKYSNLGEIQCFLIGNRRMFKRKHLDEWIKKNVPGIFKFPKEGTVNG